VSRIVALDALDLRFPLSGGAGSDAMHADPVYSFATCVLRTSDGTAGTGIALTLGRGNELVCEAIRCYERHVVGVALDTLVDDLGPRCCAWANDSQLRWLGPHKGVVHLALAAVVGAVVDLWAKAEAKPLWRLLLDLSPEKLVSLVDFSTIDDLVTPAEALDMLRERRISEAALIARGYPGYDTSVGWLGYTRDELVDNTRAAVACGFRAVKLKVGGDDDVARVAAVREAVGPDVKIMLDANQRWGVRDAIAAGRALTRFDPFWLEEPVHPDDVAGYADVARALRPLRIAGGEHAPNQVVFKNLIRAGAIQVVQADAVRLAGLPEFLAVAFMAAKAGLPVAPHAGDMGQLHQHLVVFLRCALGMDELPLEMIPHVRHAFAEPCELRDGRYVLPVTPGASTTMRA
jgi:L-fuconate dehydratase